MSEVVLDVKNLKKSFGAINVLDDVSFSLKKGEFKTIIGPNGAGKTTIYNIISGVFRPTAGHVSLYGTDITNMPSHKITKMGLSRAFQITNLFPYLTTHENIRIAAQSKDKGNFNIFKNYKKNTKAMDAANEVVGLVKLSGKENMLAKDLTHTEKRKLELGILLAMGGDILLLDEPTAGVAAEEVPELIRIVEDIKETKKKSVLLIEHKIGIILNISDTIAVLHGGTLIADETPEEIKQNEKVQKAYFGGGAKNE